METGGFKGRTREIHRHQFHQALSEHFAIQPHSIINEYGMTELTSQFYDRTLLLGQNTPDKTSSPWLRAKPVNPVTGEPMPPGQTGLLRIWDLLNLDSTVVIQTEDMAVANEDGTFRLLGRVPKSKPRGCSLPFE
jgi:acyl-coenzyme A synthetase/AMP-(fatty) acid ligase